MISELQPADKVDAIRQLQKNVGRTVMVGDGINDAPALAISDAGIAMGCGADVSRDSAQVCLLGNDLTRIPWAISLARQTRSVIRQNLFWAFAYNGAGVALAAAGFLNPAIAAGLMIVS
ncbi:MAG: HAD-IC family P-type ATPase, partial [Phycisphaerae bacterium]